MKSLCSAAVVVALAVAIAVDARPEAEHNPSDVQPPVPPHDETPKVETSSPEADDATDPTTTVPPPSGNDDDTEDNATEKPSDNKDGKMTGGVVNPTNTTNSTATSTESSSDATVTTVTTPASVTPPVTVDNKTETTTPTPVTPPANTTSEATISPTTPGAQQPAPHGRHFDGWSFFGGILLTVGFMTVGFVVVKYYRVRQGGNTFYNRF